MIVAWTIQKCSNCKRSRVHFKTNKSRAWHCLGTMPEEKRSSAKCGDPVK